MTRVKYERRKDIRVEFDKSSYKIQGIIRKDRIIHKDKDMICKGYREHLRQMVVMKIIITNIGHNELRIMSKGGMTLMRDSNNNIMQLYNKELITIRITLISFKKLIKINSVQLLVQTKCKEVVSLVILV